MKKLFSLALITASMLLLSACTEAVEEVKATVPTFAGISAIVNLTAGDAFDPLAAATATDSIDGDITADITVEGDACLLLDDAGLLTTGGITCTLSYSVTNSNGLSAMKISTVNVVKGEPVIGENMVVNGTFDTDVAAWNKLEVEGGAAIVTSVAGEMKIEIVTVGWSGTAFPRLDQGGMTYENGSTYIVTFEARADVTRSMSSQVGVFLAGAPWFVNYDELNQFELTTEMQTFTYTFTVTEDSTVAGVVTFEFGLFEGDPEGGIVTNVYLDNVEITEYTE